MRDFCAEQLEPASELCMKVWRKSGVNGGKEDSMAVNQGGTADGE